MGVKFSYIVTIEDLQCPYGATSEEPQNGDNMGYYGLSTEVEAETWREALEIGVPIVIKMLNDDNSDYTEEEQYRETDSSLKIIVEAA